MSRGHVIRGGTAEVKPFSESLVEVPTSAKFRPHEHAFRRAIDRARAEAEEAGRAEGFEAGRAAGFEAAFEKAHAEACARQSEALQEFARTLQETHDRLEAAIGEWFAASEAELEVIAVEIARKLVGQQLTIDRSFILSTAKAALQQLSDARNARIRVNPFDSPILAKAKDELLAASASLRGVEIVADDSILGGCLIETERGAVDASIDTRLQVLEGGMEEAA